MESTGALPARILVEEALKVLIKKCVNLETSVAPKDEPMAE